MKKISTIALALSLTCLPLAVQANQAAAAFGQCMTDSMNGKERKQLAKWIFFGIAAHPEIKSYSKVKENDREKADEYVGKLVTRLVVEDCPNEAQTAIKENGSAAFQFAFGKVGEVAMMELMTDQYVTQSVSGFEKYLDNDAISKILK